MIYGDSPRTGCLHSIHRHRTGVRPTQLTPRSLDLGAGTVVRAPGALRAHRSRDVAPDVVLDATAPLPFADRSLKRVCCFDVLEHIDDLVSVVTETHRVTDPTHRPHFGWRTFDYYSSARFQMARRTLRFHGGAIDTVIRRIANHGPDWYEHRLAWLFPAWYLEFELVAVE